MRSKTFEFKDLSDSREVVEHKIPNFMLWFFYFILIMLAFTLIWSYLGTIEIVVQTTGMVRTSETQHVIPLVNSNVLSVHHHESDFVHEGTLILELDGRDIEADLSNYETALSSILDDLVLEEIFLESVKTESNLFDITNITHVTKHFEMETYLELLDATSNPEKEKQTKLASINAGINQLNQTISQFQNEMNKLNRQLEHYKIYAQFDGIIHYVTPVSVGSTVLAGQELLRVHKTDKDALLTVQFFVLNQDIAQVNLGQEVRVEVPALPARTYGYLDAEVIKIESDSRVDQSSGQSYYVVTARLSSNQLTSDTTTEDILIGMQVMGRMITDEQRLLFWAIEKLELWIFR